MIRAHPVHFLLESVISPVSPGFLLWEMVLRDQNLDNKCVYCYQGIIASKTFKCTMLRGKNVFFCKKKKKKP